MKDIDELKKNYDTSNDYEHLEQLLKEGKHVVGFVTYNWNRDKIKTMMTTDVVELRLINKGKRSEEMLGGCRGISFISFYTDKEDSDWQATFIDQCKSYQLEYIEPKI